MRILLLLIAVIFFGQVAQGAVSPFDEALRLIDSGRTRDAYNKLESIPFGEQQFVDALIELQKMHYRHQQWQKFFAYAQFYRYRTVTDTAHVELKARMISLEVMALTKHCHWRTAQEVLGWALSQRGRLSAADFRELVETGEYIRLHNQFPRTATATSDLKKIANAAFSNVQVWKIKGKSMASISHPKYLSVKLKSECK